MLVFVSGVCRRVLHRLKVTRNPRKMSNSSSFSQDDIELHRLISGETPTHDANMSLLLIQLEACWRSSTTILQKVNSSLVEATTTQILLHKPTFDAEKLKLNAVEKYLQSNRKDGILQLMAGQRRGTKLCQVDRFEDETEYPEWNTTAGKLNKLIETINEKIQLDAMPERSMGYSSSSSSPASQEMTFFSRHTKLANRWLIIASIRLRTMEPW